MNFNWKKLCLSIFAYIIIISVFFAEYKLLIRRGLISTNLCFIMFYLSTFMDLFFMQPWHIFIFSLLCDYVWNVPIGCFAFIYFLMYVGLTSQRDFLLRHTRWVQGGIFFAILVLRDCSFSFLHFLLYKGFFFPETWLSWFVTISIYPIVYATCQALANKYPTEGKHLP